MTASSRGNFPHAEAWSTRWGPRARGRCLPVRERVDEPRCIRVAATGDSGVAFPVVISRVVLADRRFERVCSAQRVVDEDGDVCTRWPPCFFHAAAKRAILLITPRLCISGHICLEAEWILKLWLDVQWPVEADHLLVPLMDV